MAFIRKWYVNQVSWKPFGRHGNYLSVMETIWVSWKPFEHHGNFLSTMELFHVMLNFLSSMETIWGLWKPLKCHKIISCQTIWVFWQLHNNNTWRWFIEVPPFKANLHLWSKRRRRRRLRHLRASVNQWEAEKETEEKGNIPFFFLHRFLLGMLISVRMQVSYVSVSFYVSAYFTSVNWP